MKMKLMRIVLLGLLVATLSGCAATHAVLNKANVQDKTNAEGKYEQTVEHPAWRVLVPPAVIFDVATGPVQFVYMLCTFRDCQ